MQLSFAKSFLFSCPEILGLKLKPLSIGHFIILDMLHSPFYCGGSISNDDLITAIFVCSKSFQENLNSISNPALLKKEIKEWGIKQGKKADYKKVIKQVREYFAYYDDTPKRYIDESKQSKPNNAPWQIAITWKLLDKFEEKDIYDMAITKAFAFIACENTDDLISEFDESIIDKMEREAKEPIKD